MTLIVRPGFAYDTDASNYIDAVEVADTQALETATRYAINDFVIGCKSDGIWSAIKASCILAGARTLAGALVPLVGTAPTNNNFVSGDYNRETGLLGDGSTKYLNSNRNNDADPQFNAHLACYLSTPLSAAKSIMGFATGTGYEKYIFTGGARINGNVGLNFDATGAVGMFGASRPSSGIMNARVSGTNYSGTPAGSALVTRAQNVFARSADASGTPASHTDSRIAFYSIGESLDLAALDNRISILIAQFGAVIP